MSTVPWNANWETIEEDRPDLFPSGVNWMAVANDPAIIQTFIDAYNERIIAIRPIEPFGTTTYFPDPTWPNDLQKISRLGYPTSGIYSLSTSWHVPGWG